MLRCEELPQTWYEYNRAFTIVTEFYGREQSNTARESESLEKSGTVEGSVLLCPFPLSNVSQFRLCMHLKNVIQCCKWL